MSAIVQCSTPIKLNVNRATATNSILRHRVKYLGVTLCRRSVSVSRGCKGVPEVFVEIPREQERGII